MFMIEENEKIKITVVGLGYVGLPTALAFHDAGFNVIGIDVSNHIIKTLKTGKHHLIEESSNFKIPIHSKRWNVGSEYEHSISDSDLVLITVPTPITTENKPDLTYVESACESVLSNISKGKTTIILESTVYPGVTREILTKIGIEKNLKIGIDFDFGYSPERVSPGDVGRSSAEVAKIVGTDKKELGGYLAEIYSKVTSGGCTYVGSPEVAEAAKLIENTQRDIDIAFANELAVVLPKMGLDVEEVLEAASTKWNFHRHTPGIGIGGHCIPVDPYFYIEMSEKLGFKSIMSTAARKMNKDIEKISANEIINIINDHSSEDVVFLGYAYKPNVGDVRETPVKKICEIILNKTGITPKIWDNLVNENEIPKWLNHIKNFENISRNSIIIIGTAHRTIINMDFSNLKSKLENPIVYDGRRALDIESLENSGWKVYAIGKPNN